MLLSKALEKNKTITKIDIQCKQNIHFFNFLANKIGKSGIESLSKTLVNSKLSTLNLEGKIILNLTFRNCNGG